MSVIDPRRLIDLTSVGPATVRDLELLGITTVNQLKDCDGEDLYRRLCLETGEQHDICCLDVFNCAIAQARDANLPREQRMWWYWSRRRKMSE
ncbi:helix-hairpin-helix domain-containing protein [Emcibacter sp.]|uniref:helix-hairpin-helix domain-containing protein n=1 Tax=Emcibacter sp. TaxID=1979954 RepID=UPI002AA780D5|nr:helix-hairpin-helix domain-containing protein [Emcibacter sp.]